ncbi:MAG: HupE/UreJ family protein, partial [Candidatus Hydrogenedentes bacterium]|nr:HupE/UreJ family protein [Candidatus Hydrogenedentota bacterium]
MIRPLLAGLGLLVACACASAHEVRPARLDVSEANAGQYLVRWKVPALSGARLAIDPVFPSGCEETGERVDGSAAGAFLRSTYISCGDGLAGSQISFSNLPSTMIDVLVQITFLDGRYYTGLARPNSPYFNVPERDSESSVFSSYLGLGVEHILFGWDHLLFVLGLVLLVTSARRLIWAITGFTAAHSITLALAMLDVIRVPGPPVEAAVALSIVVLAVEGIQYSRSGVETLAIRAPWAVSMVIGLVHGLGFAGALREYGLPAHARFVSLLGFNLGVEAGQLAFVCGLLALGATVRKVDARVLAPTHVLALWFIGVCGSFWLV